MRKLVFAEVSKNDLKAVYSSAVRELQLPGYSGTVFLEGNKLIIQGRNSIRRFVTTLRKEIDECRLVFQDAESIAELDADEMFLDSLLKIKAS
jgi:hypothetical protein